MIHERLKNYLFLFFVTAVLVILPPATLNAHSYKWKLTQITGSHLLQESPKLEEKQDKVEQTETIIIKEHNQNFTKEIFSFISKNAKSNTTKDVELESAIPSSFFPIAMSLIQNPLTSLTIERTIPVDELDASQEVIDFLIGREGNASFVYPNQPSNDPFGLYNDAEGNCTVGIGRLLHSGACTGEDKANHAIEFPNGMKKDDALKLFEEDLSEVESQVKNVLKVSITQNQYDALVSFVYNEGIDVFISSKLLNDVNEFNHDPKTIEDDFLEYTRNGLLTDRRIAEANMFNNSDYGG